MFRLIAGTLQQQAAAAGAVQALAYSSDPTASLASALTGHGVVQPLVRILKTAPAAIRCAAAGALCNLALRSRDIQVIVTLPVFIPPPPSHHKGLPPSALLSCYFGCTISCVATYS